MKNLEYAKKWFELNNLKTFIDDGSLYITIDAFDIQISAAEVYYRAELFLERLTEED